MANKRSSLILNYLKQKQSAKFGELCALFPEYNQMTIRRDLILLEKNGYIIRTHGGARICENTMAETFNYSNRSVFALDEKRQIAIKASLLLEENMLIYLDAGTTNLEFAKIMPDIPLFVITNGPTLCQELAKKQNIDVMLTGGMLNKSVVTVSGPIAIRSLLDVNIDIAFMGAAGFTVENGFTNANSNECELKRHVIAIANQTVMMIDHSKIGKTRQFKFASLSDIDIIISDLPLDGSLCEQLQAYQVSCK